MIDGFGAILAGCCDTLMLTRRWRLVGGFKSHSCLSGFGQL